MNPAVLKGVLALHGGMPVRSKRLPAWPYFAEDEVAAIADVMRSGNVNYCTGEQGKAFEREFADACRTKHAVAVANGTVALELALRSVGIRSGDQVVTSSRTFCASASCIAMWGAIPVFADVDRDILKLVVVERHRATGNVGVGFVRGFKLKSGALGSTVAHDAHNVVVVGTNDKDIALAIKELEKLQGGQVAVANGKVKAELALPIAGLVSDRPLDEVIQRIAELNAAARALGCDLEAPFMTLSFLSLSPIPELKLTDQGLIDAVKMRATTLFVE